MRELDEGHETLLLVSEEQSARNRRRVVWIAGLGLVVCTGIVLALTLLALHGHGPSSFDEEVGRALSTDHENWIVALAERAIAFPGSKRGGLLIIMIAGGWWMIRRGDLRPGILLAASFTLTLASVNLLKVSIGRASPNHAVVSDASVGRSFPSMHAAILVTLIGMALVIILLSRHEIRLVPIPLAVAAGLVAIVAEAISLLNLRLHWLTDVLAGAAIAGVWVFLLLPLAHAMWTDSNLSRRLLLGRPPSTASPEPPSYETPASPPDNRTTERSDRPFG
jgi:membrane-associated phospholipid phosphatase